MLEEPEIVTFGCRLNLYESEVLRELAQKAGLSNIAIFNTCAVTAEAERQVRQAIRRVRRAHPDAILVVTGCASQIDAQKYADLPEVDYVIGNDAKLMPETFQALLAGTLPKIVLDNLEQVGQARAPLIRDFKGDMSRAFVSVQNGCDHRCTYCIIPYGRGPSRSVPLERVIEQVRLLVGQGYGEIALTGVDATSYGHDLPGQPSFGVMVRRVLMQVPELKRLRLSSIDPKEIDEALWQQLRDEPRLMPHLHLSMQAGDDMVLKRMKRRHRRDDLYALVKKARELRPDIVFGADLIAGFPTETDEMFQNTCQLLEDLDITWLHVFPYSEREGTPAAKMPPVPVPVRKERAALLRGIGQKAAHRHLESLIGHEIEVYGEKPQLARAPGFAEVRLTSKIRPADTALVKALAREGEMLVADVIKEKI